MWCSGAERAPPAERAEESALLAPDQLLRRLEWRLLRRTEGRYPGGYRTLLRAASGDFSGLRSYRWGDDVRSIDWNVSARMDELFVREYTDDRELTAWLLLDRSRSMDFGSGGRTKERMLCELAATLTQLLLLAGNRVGAVVDDGARQRAIPPRHGRGQVLALVRELLRPVGAGAPTDLNNVLTMAARLARRRSLIIVISDFISRPGWERPLLRLSRDHEVMAVRVVDRQEYELPDVGLVWVRDAETGEQLVVDTGDDNLRRRLRAAAADQDRAIRHAAARGRVDLQVVSTEEKPLDAMLRLAASRRRPR